MERKTRKLEEVDRAPRKAAVIKCMSGFAPFILPGGLTDFECATCSLVLIEGGLPDKMRCPKGLFIECGICGTMNRVPSELIQT